MKVIPIPCLKDNYAYLVVCEKTGDAAIVDPSEAEPVLRGIEKERVRLKAILNTHHHWDHVGGNKELVQKFPGVAVFGHRSDRGRIEGQTEGLDTGDTFSMGSLEVRVVHNPGHTTGAISYLIGDAMFTGDTLFAAGCGRLFEGTPAMMYASLNEVLGGQPGKTKVYFGHEYTENNLKFAQTVEPDNEDIRKKLAAVAKLRKEGRFSTPSTLSEEWRTNPFMRCDSGTIKARVRKEDPGNDLSPVSVLAVVRRMKDHF